MTAETQFKGGSLIGGALLVAGTCIGAGMLALPVLTSAGGFLPAAVIFILCWLCMASTGLLFLEISLWMGEDANIVTMATSLLGKWGKVISWLIYLYLFYSLTVAYIAGSGALIHSLSSIDIPAWLCTIVFVTIFAPLVYKGARAVDRTNFVLMIGLILSYLLFIGMGVEHVNIENLQRQNWAASLLALPIVFTSLAYQGIVPSLVTYMRRKPNTIRAAILIGTAIPLICYLVWEWLILGMVPNEGANSLQSALEQGQTAVYPLRAVTQAPWIFVLGEFFAFFALTTSFLGVSLGLRDFLADALSVRKDRRGRLALCAVIFIPALLIALTYPHLFLAALHYGGGIGVALLLGLLPVVLVWLGRYHKHWKSPYAISGGKTALVLLSLFVLLELAVEVYTAVTGNL